MMSRNRETPFDRTEGPLHAAAPDWRGITAGALSSATRTANRGRVDRIRANASRLTCSGGCIREKWREAPVGGRPRARTFPRGGEELDLAAARSAAGVHLLPTPTGPAIHPGPPCGESSATTGLAGYNRAKPAAPPLSVASWYRIVTRALSNWLAGRRAEIFLAQFWQSCSLAEVSALAGNHPFAAGGNRPAPRPPALQFSVLITT
jgi:hypothetical protein